MGQAASGNGVFGNALSTGGYAAGVFGQSSSPVGAGVQGNAISTTGFASGVFGQSLSPNGYGVYGNATATTGLASGVTGTSVSPNGTGVVGTSNATSGGTGVIGVATASTGSPTGVSGFISATTGAALSGVATATSGYTNGVWATNASTQGTGVSGIATATSGTANGVSGTSASPLGTGVYGYNSGGGTGVSGIEGATSGFTIGIYGANSSPGGYAIDGTASATSGNTSGVYGQSQSTSGTGVFGVAAASSGANFGVIGDTKSSGGIAIQAQNDATNAYVALGGNPFLINAFFANQNQGGKFSVDYSGNGFFAGNLNVTGKLIKGSGSFKIDHPLDPANKYLSHSFVESPDMMNVYNGNITTDRHGFATVTLPDYFEALNRDFRYQLTVIGQFAQAIVKEEIKDHRFTIKTNKPSVKVSWQVTGIRQDAYANANRIPVEEDKPVTEQGYYLHPEVFGQPESKSIAVAQRSSQAIVADASGK